MSVFYRVRLWWHLWRGHTVQPAGGLSAIMWTGNDGRTGHYCRTCIGPTGRRGKFIAPIRTLAEWVKEAKR